MNTKKQELADLRNSVTLDETDWRILAALQHDARLTNADLAEKIFL